MKRIRNMPSEFVRSLMDLFNWSRPIRGRRYQQSRVPVVVQALEDRSLLSGFPIQFVDPHPVTGDQFGSTGTVVVLANGNVVIASPNDNAGGTAAGAVYLFNGQTGALISTLIGSHVNDQLGSFGVKALTNGNFVIDSPNWDGGFGAVTFGNGTMGVTGTVSSSNSLVGSTADDNVGYGGVTALTNGNYVVDSDLWDGGVFAAGAVTFGNGTTGTTGFINSSNSLVGSTDNDRVGIAGVTALTNGNYVVDSDVWNGGFGAVTFGNGTTGVTGVVGFSNSLVGSTAGDDVGSGFKNPITLVIYAGITKLANGNFVVDSVDWHDFTGAVTFGSGTTGVTGAVSSSNSLIGSRSAASNGVGDLVGSDGVTVLTNGNYVVVSSLWDGDLASDSLGAVTFGNGTTGTAGIVSGSNSLVGSMVGTLDGDNVGEGGVTALANGNYVVDSYVWDNGLGAVTFGNGATGIAGTINSDNSLVGTGGGSVTALTNGNYVVVSPSGATFGNGTTGITGTISSKNTLVNAGGTVTALTNGNYVVDTPFWNGVGAITFGNGTTGISGAVNSTNSLIGLGEYFNAGSGGVTALTNGNYVVVTYGYGSWGAVTLGNGATGVAGFVSSSNSLVGTGELFQVGSSGVTALTNGNYVVDSDSWGGNTGAVTFGNGTTGVTGTVSSSNSLIGSVSNDDVGGSGMDGGGIIALASGNYVVVSPSWNKVGAVTFGNGTTGITGFVSSSNSVVGNSEFGFENVVVDNAHNAFYVSFPEDGPGTVYRGSSVSGFFLPALPNGEAALSSVTGPDGTLYDVTTIGNLYSFTPSGTSWTQIDSNVLKIAIAGNGDLVDIHTDGTLKEFTATSSASSYVQIDGGVRSFAIAGNGDVVDLHAGGGLYEFTAYRSGASMLIGSGVSQLAIAGNGDVVTLNIANVLDEFTAYRSATSFVQLDGGVTRLAIAGNGDVVDLHAGGGLFEFTAFRSAASYVQLDSGVTGMAIAGNGDVVDLRAGGALLEFTAYRSASSYVQLDGGVNGLAIAGNGDVVDLHAGGGLYEFTAYRSPASYVQLDGGVTGLAIAGNGDVVDLHAGGGLFEFTAYRSAASYVQIDGGVTAIAVAGNGDVVDLHGGGGLFEFTAYRSGAAVQLDSGVTGFAIAGNGDVVDLRSNGALYEFSTFRSAASDMQIDGGVTTFAIASNGLVEDQHVSGNKYIQTSFRSPVSQSISQFQ